MKYMNIDTIKPGMILAMTIYSDNGNILLQSNKELTQSIIERIKKLKFKGLYVYGENEKHNYEPMLSDTTRMKAIRSLKHINIDDCLYVANYITNDVLSNPDTMHELITISSYDNLTYMHSINVATLATMIGVDLMLSNEKLYEVSQAAFLHDIGKACIDEAILNKPDKLTEAEFAEMQKHPYYGYEMVKTNTNISSVIRNAIYSHHENEDGSGYPRGVTSKDIHYISKIIHVADVYDAMTSKRSYKEGINPADVLEYIMGHSGSMFDEKMVHALINCTALYPVGTEVELSNGAIATVVKNTKGYPTRPEIMLPSGATVNLIDKLNLTVTKLLTK